MPEVTPDNPRAKTRSLLSVVARFRKYPGLVAISLGLLFVNISIEMALPQILGNAITKLHQHIERGVAFAPMAYVLPFALLVVVRALIGRILGPVRNRVVQCTLSDIRASIYNALQRLAFTYHDRVNTGELISRATTDVWRLQDFLFACLLLSFDIAVALVVTTVLIFNISPILGWVALLTMVPTVALIGFYAAKLQPQWREVHDQHGAMTTVLQENIAGVKVVKAFAREESEIMKFRARKDKYLGQLLQTVNYWTSRVPLAQFIYGLSTPLALWIGGRQVIAGELLLGDLAKVVFYLMAIGHRVGMVGQFTNIIQNASASAERILEIIREPKTIRSGKRMIPPGRGEVQFDHVSFSYPSRPPALSDVSFVAEPGKTVAIVGSTGSGKSTLVNLIPRFYDPTEGCVRVDGVDVRELNLNQLRQSVSMIFQETFLFSTSVAENIAYGKPHATREDIERAARAAQADEFIRDLEEGYDSIIGERGVSLSGGQRQRLAIARAFLMDPRILILDDATSSVDSYTERQIQEAMRELCAHRTSFVIAQRLSTVQHADLIIVLQNGQIAARGTHQDLLQSAKIYRDLFVKDPPSVLDAKG